MSSPPFISILIPMYNGIEFLEECLASIIQQTYPHWIAYVGINGHGSDGGEVALRAKEIAERDPRIHVLIQGPIIKGKVASLNQLMETISTDWVA